MNERMQNLAEALAAVETRVPLRDYTGFRARAQRMTERLIDALFPNFADGPVTREQALS